MPNDAKLGLVVGLTLVIMVAILFTRKEGKPIDPGLAQVNPPPSTNKSYGIPIPGMAGMTAGTFQVNATVMHTFEDGETLMSLSQRYYGDRDHVSDIFRANQDRIHSPDRVPIGTVLRIPKATRSLAEKK